MYKDYRYINAGDNEIYRYGHKAQELIESYKKENNGYYSIPVDGGKYYTFGTSNGKYGEFMKYNDTIFSVNKGGFAYVNADSEKAQKFLNMLDGMIDEMKRLNAERIANLDTEEEE